MDPGDLQTEAERRAFVEGMVRAHGIAQAHLRDSVLEQDQRGAFRVGLRQISEELVALRKRWRLPG